MHFFHTQKKLLLMLLDTLFGNLRKQGCFQHFDGLLILSGRFARRLVWFQVEMIHSRDCWVLDRGGLYG